MVTRVDREAASPASARDGASRRSDRRSDRDLLRAIPEGRQRRGCRTSKPGASPQTRLRGPAGSKVDVTFEDGEGTPVTVVARRGAPSTAIPSRSATCRRCTCASRTEMKPTPAAGPPASSGSTSGWRPSTRSFRQAMDEFRQRRRHHHRSARQSRRAGGDDHGHLGTLRQRTRDARRDEDARERAAVRRESAARQRQRASASSRSPGRSRFSSTR